VSGVRATVIKTLFAFSGNVCAFIDIDTKRGCEEPLTNPTWQSVNARVCHIRGRRRGSARYDPNMTAEERNGFENLILLCPTHHVRIDDLEPERYTIEVLQDMKERCAQTAESVRKYFKTEAELDRVTGLTLKRMQAEWAFEDQLGGEIEVEAQAASAIAVAGTARASVEDEPKADDSATRGPVSRGVSDEAKADDSATRGPLPRRDPDEANLEDS
jgi:hypothetical protein